MVNKIFIAFLMTSMFSYGSSFSIDTMAATAWSVSQSWHAACLNSANSVAEIPIVKKVSDFRVDSTLGFKTSVALLGLWSIPLICNLARWQWKKRKVKRKISAEPTEANIRAFHTNRGLNTARELSETLLTLDEVGTLTSVPGYMPNGIINLISGYDVHDAEHAEQEIKNNVERDMRDVRYQSIVPINVRSRCLTFISSSLLYGVGAVYIKRQVYDVGLQVLWRGFAYGPGQVTSWLLLGGTEVGSFFSLFGIGVKIFNRPLLRNDCYTYVGASLYLSACLFLNMMLIDRVITQRLK